MPGVLRLAKVLLYPACRILRRETRAEHRAEWSAELYGILDDTDIARGQRVIRALMYSIDQTRTAICLEIPAETRRRTAVFAAGVLLAALTYGHYSDHYAGQRPAEENYHPQSVSDLYDLYLEKEFLELDLKSAYAEAASRGQLFKLETIGPTARLAGQAMAAAKRIEAELADVQRQIRQLDASETQATRG